jgi:hypothetical protein
MKSASPTLLHQLLHLLAHGPNMFHLLSLLLCEPASIGYLLRSISINWTRAMHEE